MTISTGDLDRDGRLDILVATESRTRAYYFRSDDGINYNDTSLPNEIFYPNFIYSDDVDKDGDLDLIYSASESNGVTRIACLSNLANDPSVTGQLYLDENENGIFDANEMPVNGVKVNVEPSPIATFTDNDGRYTFYITDDASYTVSLDLGECWEQTSTPLTYELVPTGEQLVTDLDFGVNLIGVEEKMHLNLTSGPTRCGFTVPFWLNVTNDACVETSGFYHLVLSDLVTFVDAEPMPDLVMEDTLVWEYNNLIAGANDQVSLNLEIAGVDFLGETIAMTAAVYVPSDTGGFWLAEEYFYESVINCAYDPNDKLVYPRRSEGDYQQDFTLFDEFLEYTIRFQNTGTDTAFNVQLIDQLSPDLDLETFTPGTASHPYEVTLENDGRVYFDFRNILLPDSTTNEMASHGYVNFRIKAKAGIEEASLIENTAGIYFDFNPPIITNTTENVMVSELPSLLPMPDFGYDINVLEVNFMDLTTNGVESWLWDFGDGNTSTEQDPMHIYEDAGDYEVCLIATNNFGVDTICQAITIVNIPVSNFTYTIIGYEVSFEDNSTNMPTEWVWSFGDGNTSEEQNPTYVYDNFAEYFVCLTATNSAGSDLFCEVITVIEVAVEDVTAEPSLLLFPNPANEMVTVLLGKEIQGEYQIRIFDVLGRNLGLPIVQKNNQFVLNVGALSEGIYFVEILLSEQERLTGRFIVSANK